MQFGGLLSFLFSYIGFIYNKNRRTTMNENIINDKGYDDSDVIGKELVAMQTQRVKDAKAVVGMAFVSLAAVGAFITWMVYTSFFK